MLYLDRPQTLGFESPFSVECSGWDSSPFFSLPLATEWFSAVPRAHMASQGEEEDWRCEAGRTFVSASLLTLSPQLPTQKTHVHTHIHVHMHTPVVPAHFRLPFWKGPKGHSKMSARSGLGMRLCTHTQWCTHIHTIHTHTNAVHTYSVTNTSIHNLYIRTVSYPHTCTHAYTYSDIQII